MSRPRLIRERTALATHSPPLAVLTPAHRPRSPSFRTASAPFRGSCQCLRPLVAFQHIRLVHQNENRDDKHGGHGTGPLEAGARSPARRSRRQRLHELVCPHGPRGDRGRHRQAVGADALPQELDRLALHREGHVLLAGGTARGVPHRDHRALRRHPPAAREGGAGRSARPVTRQPRVQEQRRRRHAPQHRRRSRPCTRHSAARRSTRA